MKKAFDSTESEEIAHTDVKKILNCELRRANVECVERIKVLITLGPLCLWQCFKKETEVNCVFDSHHLSKQEQRSLSSSLYIISGMKELCSTK